MFEGRGIAVWLSVKIFETKGTNLSIGKRRYDMFVSILHGVDDDGTFFSKYTIISL